MILKNENSKLKLLRIKELYEESRLAMSDDTERLEKNMRQYLGSSEIDGGEAATTVRNITYEIIESEINSDIPTPKADSASYSPAREQNAHAIERLCASVKERLPFEEMNDLDERYTYIYGASVWYVEWDAEKGDGGVNVYCLSPLNFFGQAGVTHVRDMEYCFLRFTTTKGELMRKYGVTEKDTDLCDCSYQYGEGSSSDTLEMVICFYKDADGDVAKFVFSGDLVLSDVEKYYKRKIRRCRICKKPHTHCLCPTEDLETVDATTETLKNTGITLPYFVPTDYPIIIRKNTIGDGGIFGGSDCEMIRPQQQAINKIESRILQKLLRSGVTPIMPEDSTVTLTNSVFGQVIKMRPGERADVYGTLDTTPDIRADIEEADRLYDQAKRIIGISDALQGTDTVINESGYARQLKIDRATSRLEAKRRLKYLTYSEMYRLIFLHYLAFADAPRRLSYKDGFGNLCLSEFNRHDFIEQDGEGGFGYADGYIFSVDLNGGNEYQREVLWERNLKNLESGSLGDPADPGTLLRYWQSQERAHYPFARENVEYFTILAQNQKNKESENKND